MASLVRELAEAVKATVEAMSFEQEFVVQRLYVPRFEQMDSQKLSIFVASAAETQARFDRGRWQQDHEVHIALCRKLDDGETEELDSLMDDAEVLKAGLKAAPIVTLAGGTKMSLLGLANDPIYDPDDIKQNLFRSLVRATYRVIA